MPSIKDSAFGGFLFWPQLDAEARRELKALPTSKETPTEEEVLLDRYANQMCQRGVLGQVLVIMSPIFFVLLGLTQHPNFGWAALVALFGGLATFLKAAWDIAKQDDPDFKPPHDTVRRWDMNDWREGTWVIAVLMFFFLSACTWWILDSLLWFLMPIAPKKLQEISRS
ncbi:hypothetical protein DTB58_40110, partial [Streptomyces griseus]|uniref:hypothetical protein n=1 Tax=Streptomyces griseus TaxID=1911 RepID=UPI001C57501D